MAYKTTYPYTNEILATFDNATDEALGEALANEHALYKKWRAEGGLDERKVQLRKIAELLRRDVDKYAEVMTKDMGKLFVEAKGEVDLCAEIADYYADKAEEFLKPRPLENINGDAYYIKQATGVLVAVEPWNFPFYQIMRVFAPNYKVDTEEEAITLANDSRYGLGGTVFSENLNHAKEVAAKIETGMSFINSGWTSHPEIPFGGIKNSGYGRELSELGFDAFVNEHLVFVPND